MGKISYCAPVKLEKYTNFTFTPFMTKSIPKNKIATLPNELLGLIRSFIPRDRKGVVFGDTNDEINDDSGNEKGIPIPKKGNCEKTPHNYYQEGKYAYDSDFSLYDESSYSDEEFSYNGIDNDIFPWD
jgi:hypothetical protein